jgi:hypothetical protein
VVVDCIPAGGYEQLQCVLLVLLLHLSSSLLLVQHDPVHDPIELLVLSLLISE